jgi:hypothetical protein
MALRIESFVAAHVPAVREFNRRMRAGGSTWQFPEDPVPSWLARVADSAVYQEFFVALDGEVVRGAYALAHRGAAVGDASLELGAWYLPISEGAVDPRHALVATLLMRDALRRAPLSYGLGMDGMDSQLSKLAAAMKCERRLVPFLVRVEHGGRFAREARALRREAWRARALDLAAFTGLAALGAGLARLALRTGPGLDGATVEQVAEFGPWADELWERCRGHYSFVERRDAATLARIYPVERPRFLRLRVLRGAEAVGWAVLQRAEMRDNPNFGSMHVGRITDVFAAPADAGVVTRAAADALAASGVDVMVSNQLHPDWVAALRRNAFLTGPSTYVFAPTAPLAEAIRAADPAGRRVHVNRGDGDGPWGHDPRGF